MVIFFWDMINFFAREFQDFESKAALQQKSLDTLYTSLKILIGFMVTFIVMVFWYRQSEMLSYMSVFFGFKKTDCQRQSERITEYISDLTQMKEDT